MATHDEQGPTSLRGILFSDMVGSTEQRGRLGEDRADLLRRAHDDILARCIDDHGGRALRWTGDGVKADFPTASAAVAAALDMQRAVERYGRTAHAVAPFSIRIGLGVGEVSFEGDDIHGVAVIEAARLEALAEPGAILATDLVHRLGERRVDAGFESLGPMALKGLPDPVEAVRIVDTRRDPAARPLPRTVLVDDRFPLVGRAADLETATTCWEEALAGRPSMALITGPAGLGKSRFIARVADLAHSQGATVLAGVCDSDLDVPYQPFAMAFDEAKEEDDELATAVEHGGGPLGPLFPNRRRLTADPGPSARFDLFEAVVALLDRLTEDAPVVVALEDLHWATPPTVQLLRHVVRHAGSSRVLVLASYRAEEIGPGHPLNDLLAEVRPGAAICKIDLRPLGDDEVAQLIAARVPAAAAAGGERHVGALARRVGEESGGNPFFVCELLHHLATVGELERLVGRDAPAQLPIPDSVRDIVGQRLVRLGTGTGEILQLAAVIGQTFDIDLLGDVAAQPVEDVLGVLEEAERVGLVREAAAGRFGFAHAILRTTLLESSSATRRKLTHRRIAEAIERLAPDDHDDLARHWLAAGVEDRAHEKLELAAARDLAALAYESSADRYQSLIGYHGRVAGDESALARAWLGLGLARRAMGLPVYREAIDEAGRLARRLRDADLMADTAIASIWPGTMFATAGEVDTEMVELCEDALAMIDPADRRRIRILSTLASHLTFEADRTRRAGFLAEARDLARADGGPELIGSVLVAEYLCLWDPSTSDRRAEIAHEVARTARATGDADLRFFGGLFTAVGTAERCNVHSARRQLEGLREAAEATRNFYFRFLVDRYLLSLDILSSRPDAQADVDALAAEYADTHADTAGTWSIQTGGIAMQTGRFASLAPTLEGMIRDSSVSGNWFAAYGIALAEGGDRAAANGVLDELTEPPLDYFWLVTMQSIVELVTLLGRADRAGRLRSQLEPYRDHLGIAATGSLCLGLVRTSLGQLALLDGDVDAAIELLEGAVRVADEMGAPYESTKSRRALAEAYLARGDAELAAATLRDAAALAGRHGFAGEAMRLDALSSAQPAN